MLLVAFLAGSSCSNGNGNIEEVKDVISLIKKDIVNNINIGQLSIA